jgi:lipopolysaccharide/colanic/teichoic acid biosynthesis glycosyltransferase
MRKSLARQLKVNGVKRVLDITSSLLLLAICAPLMALTALSVRLTMGSPILLRQTRPGLSGHPFTFLKFRSMTEACDADGKPLPDAQRLTPFGHWLRGSSLDELPQLINVLRGDMSLVGPRPLLMEYLPLYSPYQARRHEVRPGITGWAQVNGRNAIAWEEKFEYDVWYVEHQSFLLDMRILFMTFLRLFQRADVSHGGHATMPRFTGSGQHEV